MSSHKSTNPRQYFTKNKKTHQSNTYENIDFFNIKEHQRVFASFVIYLWGSFELGIIYTHSLFVKVFSIQDFWDWKIKKLTVLQNTNHISLQWKMLFRKQELEYEGFALSKTNKTMYDLIKAFHTYLQKLR